METIRWGLTCCWMLVFVCCAALTSGKSVPVEDKALRIAAFNIQNLGTKKIQNLDVLHVIIKILSRYDIVLVQEIVDRKEKVIVDLLKELNRPLDSKHQYDVIIGPRVGRTMAKEQYAYIYRKAKVDLLNSYSYHDEADVFEREPFIAVFKPAAHVRKTLSKFALVGIHTKPTAAIVELQHLDVVADYVANKEAKDVIIMGDFNADCDYVRKKRWPTIPLWTNSKYVWLIGHEIDTTASASNCAYDRIVIMGDKMKHLVVKESAVPFGFDKVYGLDTAAATAVSDHYPVEVTLNLTAQARRRSSG